MIEEEGLQAHCGELGNHMLPRLAELRDRFSVVGDVRGKGLMMGVELVADKVGSSRISFCSYWSQETHWVKLRNIWKKWWTQSQTGPSGYRDCIWLTTTTLDWKKEPSSRFAATRMLFRVWYHARSRAIKRRAKVADSYGSDLALRWSLVIEHDITRGTAFFSPRISSMVLFFCPG